MFNIVTVRSAFVGTYLRSSDLKIFKVWQLCNLNIFKFNIRRLCLIAKDLPLVIILLKSYSYLQILITNVLIILWRVWIHKRSSIPRFFHGSTSYHGNFSALENYLLQLDLLCLDVDMASDFRPADLEFEYDRDFLLLEFCFRVYVSPNRFSY